MGPSGAFVTYCNISFLNVVFNNIFSSGNIPDSWGKSIIWPLHKNGSLYDPNNFRGIASINTICKIFTKILVSRLDSWTKEFNVGFIVCS